MFAGSLDCGGDGDLGWAVVRDSAFEVELLLGCLLQVGTVGTSQRMAALDAVLVAGLADGKERAEGLLRQVSERGLEGGFVGMPGLGGVYGAWFSAAGGADLAFLRLFGHALGAFLDDTPEGW